MYHELSVLQCYQICIAVTDKKFMFPIKLVRKPVRRKVIDLGPSPILSLLSKLLEDLVD